MEINLKSLWLNIPSDAVQLWLLWVSANWCALAASHVLFLSLSLKDVLPVIKDLHFSVSWDTSKALMWSRCSSWLFCHPDAGGMSFGFLVDWFQLWSLPPLLFPDQKNIRSHPDHHPGHGDHWRLWRVRVFPPQSIHWVGQVNCVRNVPQQTQHCQEKGQPARDRAILLYGERRFKYKGLLPNTN